ncbi:MAG: late competence development ComFB family protein [Candidatus Omnitrophica bacterium]|nr:late competence development ComFB family protein [Candidatus Omnitrophota bacterium]
MEKLKNIIEDIAIDFLNNTLVMRKDICTCQSCKNDMMAHILSHVPAKYVTTEKGALHTIIDQTRIEKEAEIGRAVINAISVISKSPRHGGNEEEDKNQSFEILLNKIYDDRGVDFRHYHKEILKRRLSIRMNVNRVQNFSDYLRLLINSPQEYDKLFEVFCINVSEFFRDPDVWESVKKILKELIQKKISQNERKLIIWSSASASGEEPYSIAILVKELSKTIDTRNLSIEITGTDIDEKALRACGKAEYPKAALKNVSDEFQKLYFTQQFTGNFKLKDEIKRMVNFKSLDLIASDYIPNTDLVFCRNVFIYFTRSLQDQLLMKFYRSLIEGGYFVMGKTETMWMEAKEIFEELDFRAHIYRKRTSRPD